MSKSKHHKLVSEPEIGSQSTDSQPESILEKTKGKIFLYMDRVRVMVKKL